MIRVELLQNEVITWPSTMLRKDSQNQIMPDSSCLVCHGHIACGRGLCVLVIQLYTSPPCPGICELWLCYDLYALIQILCPFSAVTWPSTKLQQHTGPTTLLSDSLSTFPFWEAERRNRHAIYQAKTVEPQKETLPFMSKPPPFSRIHLI